MKPNPDEFAKEVLWQLALLRAELQQIRSQNAVILSKQTGKPYSEIQKTLLEKKIEEATKLYQKSAKAVGLADQSIPNHNGDS